MATVVFRRLGGGKESIYGARCFRDRERGIVRERNRCVGLEGEREGDMGLISWWLMAEMWRLGDGFTVPLRGSSWRLLDFAYRSFMVELLVQLRIYVMYIYAVP